jgi:hypothetical protein
MAWEAAIRGRPVLPVGTVLVTLCGQEAGVATKITVLLEDDLDGGPAGTWIGRPGWGSQR